eukprot:GHVU01163157.1.p1 GENE.GHVU01163157.1~~GHVU01163157.1.p1  ORF type:complete len:193 (+),score=17.28 GHVU01163157.1:351-929(+)
MDGSYMEYLQNKELISVESEKFKEHMKAFDALHGGWMRRGLEEEEGAVTKEIMAQRAPGKLRDCWGIVRRGLAIASSGDECEREHFVSARTHSLKQVVYEGNLFMELWACLSLSRDPECFYYFSRSIACALLVAQRCKEGNHILEMLICDEKQAMQAIETVLRVACNRFWSRVRYIECWSPPASSPREMVDV